MTFDAMVPWFEQNGVPDFREKVENIFMEHIQQHTCLHAPCMKFIYEFIGRGLQEKYGFDFMNYWGNDIVLDENFNPIWVESNLAASNGDKAEEQDDCGYAQNLAFQTWGQETIQLWLAAARDPQGYINSEEIPNFRKVIGNEGDFKYEKEQETLNKIFDLWLWITTGTTKLPPVKLGEHYDRFPVRMNMEQCLKLHTLIPRISEDEIKVSYGKIYESSDNKDEDYFHLLQVILDLYTREEILEIYEKISK